MTRKLKLVLGGAYALFVAVALTFGATQALAGAAEPVCGDQPEELGTCPPFDDASCDRECFKTFGTTGQCIPNEQDGCCVCVL